MLRHRTQTYIGHGAEGQEAPVPEIRAFTSLKRTYSLIVWSTAVPTIRRHPSPGRSIAFIETQVRRVTDIVLSYGDHEMDVAKHEVR